MMNNEIVILSAESCPGNEASFLRACHVQAYVVYV